MNKVLFIDRDGVLLHEPADEQIDSLDKVVFPKGMLNAMSTIAKALDYKLVMVTNQDGLGTNSYPEGNFWPYQELLLQTLDSVGVVFDEICIDRSFPADNSKYRKPEIGMLTKYKSDKYDLANSIVIGDRYTDMQLAVNLGSKGIWIHPRKSSNDTDFKETVILESNSWDQVLDFLLRTDRKSKAQRSTSETKIEASINLDGSGLTEIQTGIGFFDHMLSQIAKHASLDLFVNCEGDLNVDEHHTIEDVAITLGQLFFSALGKKAGINRYGYAIPMDDSTAQVLIDFGGRPWLEWSADFYRESVGGMPTEMFYHFFKSFSDNAQCNINIRATGKNEHHKIEAIFKAFAKSIKMAKARSATDISVPSTKGTL